MLITTKSGIYFRIIKHTSFTQFSRSFQTGLRFSGGISKVNERLPLLLSIILLALSALGKNVPGVTSTTCNLLGSKAILSSTPISLLAPESTFTLATKFLLSLWLALGVFIERVGSGTPGIGGG